MKKIQHHEIFPLGIPAILEVFEAEGSFPAVLTLEGGERLEMDLSRPSHAIGDLLDEIREFAEASLGKQG